MNVVISLTDKQIFTAVRTFLLSLVPNGVDVIKGQDNRVPEPHALDFILIQPHFQQRLATNLVLTYDDILVGSIAGTTLTVASIPQKQVDLLTGMTVIGSPAQPLAANTILGNPISIDANGIGTYQISPSQTVASQTMYLGFRADVVATQMVVQMDVHGPNASDYTRIIEGLFRSERGTEGFDASGFDIAPLYCEDPREVPFVNAETEYEFRWVIDACLQINPVIKTPQQFADQLHADLIVVDIMYAP